MFEWDPLMAVGLFLCVKLVNWVWKEIQHWIAHFSLANLISDWHREGLQAKMKAKGIKFAPRPVPRPLMALPCNRMVLSCVMLSMWSVAPLLQPPVPCLAAWHADFFPG